MGSVATSVLPSPVFISAILPLCRMAPPINWTSKWRWPMVRRLPPRAGAEASGGRTSRGPRAGGRPAPVQGVGDPRAELVRLGPQRLGGEALHLGLKLVDSLNDRLQAADLPLAPFAQQPTQQPHAARLLSRAINSL